MLFHLVLRCLYFVRFLRQDRGSAYYNQTKTVQEESSLSVWPAFEPLESVVIGDDGFFRENVLLPTSITRIMDTETQRALCSPGVGEESF